MTEPEDDRPHLDPALQALFRGAKPPPEVGHALARAARIHSRRLIVTRWRRRLVPVGLAAAAGLAGVVLLRSRTATDPATTQLATQSETRLETPPATFDVADLDESGRVDVWDAYLLAQAADAGTAGPRFDLDGDGSVTRADADLVARRAVEVPR